MMRSMFLVAFLLASNYAHHGNADDHDHDHDEEVEAHLDPDSPSLLIVSFYSSDDFDSVTFTVTVGSQSYSGTDSSGESHGDHTDWERTFTNIASACDDITVNVVGTKDNVNTPAANESITVEDPSGDSCD